MDVRQLFQEEDQGELEKRLDRLVSSGQEGRRLAAEGRRYYRCDNDIRRRRGLEDALRRQRAGENPLRNADFRIAHNFHQLLVDQKAAYLFSYAPVFDSGRQDVNQKLRDALGADFARVVKDLAIDAANAGCGWLHLWREDGGGLRFHTVAAEELCPIYGGVLNDELTAMLRVYEDEDEKGRPLTRYELWDETEALFFVRRGKRGLTPDPRCGDQHRFRHGLGFLPFVPFGNNRERRGDLVMVKDLIDQYDLVVSGFANDLTDIQEVIFVLRNYGGEDLNTFLSELKRYKAVKVEGENGDGGVETMRIEIPIEARVRFLEILRRQIFVSGQGVDPDPRYFGNSSGVALKYLYSLLEIKAGLLETEFRAGFRQLLRIVLSTLDCDPELEVAQVFTRNGIESETEAAEIAVKSRELISRETLLQNHPWVEDPAAELRNLGQANEK